MKFVASNMNLNVIVSFSHQNHSGKRKQILKGYCPRLLPPFAFTCLIPLLLHISSLYSRMVFDLAKFQVRSRCPQKFRSNQFLHPYLDSLNFLTSWLKIPQLISSNFSVWISCLNLILVVCRVLLCLRIVCSGSFYSSQILACD